MPAIEEGQVWRDRYDDVGGVRFIRIEKIERVIAKKNGVTVPLLIARISSARAGGPWRRVTRYLRVDRIAKFYALEAQ